MPHKIYAVKATSVQIPKVELFKYSNQAEVYSNALNDNGQSTHVVPVTVWTSLGEFKEQEIESIREAALGKLTQIEKRILGLV